MRVRFSLSASIPAWLPLAVLVSGCGASPKYDTFDAYCAAVVQAVCARSAACPTEGNVAADSCADFVKATYCNCAEPGLTAKQLTYQSSKSQACLDSIASLDCAAFNLGPTDTPQCNAAIGLAAGAPLQCIAADETEGVMTTITDLANFGEKRVGTMPGKLASEYLRERFVEAGLAGVHTESFQFPRHDVMGTPSLSVTINGAARKVGFDVFEASGAGHASGSVVFAGAASTSELSGLDVRGKVALVEQSASATIHRAVQYHNLVAAGAVAMVYESTAPDNLRQVGSIRYKFESMGPIPAITIGNSDAEAIKTALAASQPVQAVIDVQAQMTPATGQNVIGRIVGSDPSSGEIIVGAHYDTWFAGSSDNGAGTAELLDLAAHEVAAKQPRYTIIFVAYDGEEVGLYGGYDFLRRHHIIGQEPILAFINLEMPASADGSHFLAVSQSTPLNDAYKASGLTQLYSIYAYLQDVPPTFGGIIPTDIQGIYWNGLPASTTFVVSAYYHTDEDTPDKVDYPLLVQSVGEFEKALAQLMTVAPMSYGGLDPSLWTAQVTARQGDPLAVDVTVADAMGHPQAGAQVAADLVYNDFFVADHQAGVSDANGKLTLTFKAGASKMGQGNRFVHVTAGKSYPLTEQIVALP